DAGEPRGVEHDLGALRNAPSSPELLDGLRIDGGRIGDVAVDAAVDNADAILGTWRARFDHRRGVAGIGDDAVALRHDAVIGGLERADLAIGAVIGGDERFAGAARRAQRAPSRCPAPRMHEIDLAVLYQLGEAPDIGKDGEVGFCSYRTR